jgi:F-type H+-transporting ATPase subunit c
MVENVDWTNVAAFIAAGLCMGFGGLGPSLGQGFIAGKACENVGKKPENSGQIIRTMVLGMAITETATIFALLVSLILLFVVAK